MTIKVLFLLSFLLLLSFVSGSKQAIIKNEETKIIDAINKFSHRFYTEAVNIEEIKGKDAIMSALSAQIALAILSLGAGGETLEQLSNALNLPRSDFAKSSFPSAITKLNSLRGVTLNFANKIYVNKNHELNPVVQNEAKELFIAEIENMDFGNVKSAVNTINSWVEQKTNSRIKNMIVESMISDALRLIIINAIYFKGKWENPFVGWKTRDSDFFVNSVTKARVDMMNQKSRYPYLDIEELNAQVVELYYEKRKFSMIIVLPKKIEGLSDLEKNLRNVNMKTTIFDRLRETELSLSIPKFKIETKMHLNIPVQNLGAKLIFDSNKANLTTLLTQQEQMFVDFVIQKSFVEVNEEGTEAAAVTVIGMLGSGLSPIPPLVVNANHPFLFYIKSIKGNILFSGRFTGSNLSDRITISPVE